MITRINSNGNVLDQYPIVQKLSKNYTELAILPALQVKHEFQKGHLKQIRKDTIFVKGAKFIQARCSTKTMNKNVIIQIVGNQHHVLTTFS